MILPPHPSYPQTSSPPQTFRNKAQNGFSEKFFTLRDKKFDENRDLFRLSINIFDTRNQWHTRGLSANFSALQDKKFWLKLLILPLFHPQTSSLPEPFQNTAQNGSPAKFLGTARQKKSTKNREIILLSIKLFHTRNQWHPRGFPYEIFRHCETKTFWQKTLIHPASSSSTNLFATGNFPKQSTEWFPCNVFWHCETKKFDKKSWLNPLKHKIFRYPKSVKHRRVPLRNFSVLWDRTISAENRAIRPLSHPYCYSVPETFWNTEGFLDTLEGSSTNFLGTETKCFRQKFLIPPVLLIHKILHYRKLSETRHRTVPLQSFFGTARQKKSTKNRDIILLSIKFFDTWNQCHPRGLPYEFFRHCETKTFWQETLIHPRVLLIHKLIRYRKLSETQLRMVPLQCFSALRDKKIRQKIVT